MCLALDYFTYVRLSTYAIRGPLDLPGFPRSLPCSPCQTCGPYSKPSDRKSRFSIPTQLTLRLVNYGARHAKRRLDKRLPGQDTLAAKLIGRMLRNRGHPSLLIRRRQHPLGNGRSNGTASWKMMLIRLPNLRNGKLRPMAYKNQHQNAPALSLPTSFPTPPEHRSILQIATPVTRTEKTRSRYHVEQPMLLSTWNGNNSNRKC